MSFFRINSGRLHHARTSRIKLTVINEQGSPPRLISQRVQAQLALLLCVFEIMEIWLTTGMRAAPFMTGQFIAANAFFTVALLINVTLLLWPVRRPAHWLRVTSWITIAVMVAPIAFVFLLP